MSGNSHPVAGLPKKKRRGLKFLILLLLLLAGGGVWASFEYMRSGEVLIPMPEGLSKFINDNLVAGGRLGPVRFGEYAEQGLPPAREVVQNFRPEDSEPPLVSMPDQGDNASEFGWGPGDGPVTVPPGLEDNAPVLGQADPAAPLPDLAADPAGDPAVQPLRSEHEPTGQAATEPVSPRPAPPPQPVAGGKVTPPDTGWRDQAATPYEELHDSAATAEEPAPRRQPSRHDVAVFEAPDPEAPVMAADAGSSLVLAFDSSAESRPTALMPVNLSAEPKAPAGISQRPKVYSGEDSVVTLDFVGDLATYLAASYWPAGSHPSAKGKDISTASLKSLNQRYGIDLHGFRAGPGTVRDYNRDREQILNYAFMPSMLQALTNLYLDRFADALAGMDAVTDVAGNTRRFSQAQRVNMLQYYSSQARALSDAINAYASAPNAAALVNAYIRSEQEAQSANARYLDAKQSLEIATEQQDQAGMREAAQDVARLETAYRRSMERRRNAEAAVRTLMTRGTSGRLGGADLVYVGCWLNRRAANEDTLRAAVASTQFAARVLSERAVALRDE